MTGSSPVRRESVRSESNDHLFVLLAAHRGIQRRLVSNALLRHGARVAAVDSFDELRDALQALRPDVAVVDVAIATDQREILALVRDTGTALIAVAVRNPAARVELLLAGADDCLPASYAPEELTARVIAIVRRTYRVAAREAGRVLRGGPLRLDVSARRVEVGGSEVFLTAMEFDLLSCFVRHAGETLSRERLLAEVWGYTTGAAATVTVHVRRLRSKIEADPSRPELVHTVWGIGYRFCAEEPHRSGGLEPAVGPGEHLASVAAVAAEQPALVGSAVSADQEHGMPVP